MSKNTRLQYLAVLVASMAMAGLSNSDDAPNDALEMLTQIRRQNCKDMDNPTLKEKLETHRAVLRKALAIVADVRLP